MPSAEHEPGSTALEVIDLHPPRLTEGIISYFDLSERNVL